MASSTAARSPTGERARRRARAPASKPRWRRPARSARPPWLVAVASVAWREKEEGKNELGFEGRRVVVGFDPANRAGDRPIKIDGRDRASPPGLAGGPCGRGRGRRGGPIQRPGRWLSGLGPKEWWPSRPRAGFASGPPKQCSSFYCFFYFSRSNFNSFLNGFDYSLISIQFCTNVFIV